MFRPVNPTQKQPLSNNNSSRSSVTTTTTNNDQRRGLRRSSQPLDSQSSDSAIEDPNSERLNSNLPAKPVFHAPPPPRVPPPPSTTRGEEGRAVGAIAQEGRGKAIGGTALQVGGGTGTVASTPSTQPVSSASNQSSAVKNGYFPHSENSFVKFFI